MTVVSPNVQEDVAVEGIIMREGDIIVYSVPNQPKYIAVEKDCDFVFLNK